VLEMPEYQSAMEGDLSKLVTFTIPTIKPNVTVPVIEVFLK